MKQSMHHVNIYCVCFLYIIANYKLAYTLAGQVSRNQLCVSSENMLLTIIIKVQWHSSIGVDVNSKLESRFPGDPANVRLTD